MTTKIRDKLVKRLKDDLLGPISVDEVLYDKYPSDRYLFGILFPPETPIPTEDDDTNEAETEGDIEDTSSTEQVAISKTFRPSSMGLSFIVNTTNVPKVNIEIILGTYTPVEYCSLFDDEGKKLDEKQRGKISNLWYRNDHKIQKEIDLSSSMEIKTEIDFLSIYVRSLKNNKDKSKITATISILNTFVYEENEKRDKREIESKSFFQTGLKISGNNCNILPRENFADKGDYDTRSSSLIYRDNIEYASGHTCSASWNNNLENITISSDWLPSNIVKRTDPTGDDIFASTMRDAFSIEKNFNASDLADADKDKIKKILECIPKAYSNWIKEEKIKLENLEKKFYKQAKEHIIDCEKALRRLQEGVEAIISTKETINAFAYANEAMIRQAKWTERNNEYELQWRPFQLGFMLLSANSIINKDSIERDILDLLWFPTGGGKTEAYLLISCFLIFLRRIQSNDERKYEGINIFMRYTLRTLTVQQFQRATKMIISCEITRLKNIKNYKNLLDQKPISIGLWVGSKTTPNRYHEALDKIYEEDGSTPNQMQDCPCCFKKLKWSKDYSSVSKNYLVLPKCQNENCEISTLGFLPVYTVDDYVYEKKPTLLIGTIDKFAQITRSNNIKSMLSIDKETKDQTPELIIQDELHLISGPLGTLAGLYEIAIDEFCSSKGVKPKIIGSTATIKRAQDQVKRLFNRQSFQFPPPAIDASNSCFAKEDKDDDGRLYLGLTTAGRSQRYVVQQTCASLLQSINDPTIDKDGIDPYTTLVSYYNSLRELGGSIVLMQDDVRSSMEILSTRYNEKIRQMGSPEELKGSLSSSVVRNLLAKLEKEKFYYLEEGKLKRNEECIDILLATNMLSVGVDINRLGLMVVNGQPKTMSEYIQSTSRIGRKHPGLVISVYNNQRNRDKSHFESFSTWHGALYKDIEATSVTPFAPRAREKALHAVLIALSRNLVNGLEAKPNLTKEKRKIVERNIIPIILNRILQIDEEEHDDAKKELDKLLDDWEKRSLVGDLKHYWVESHFHRKKSLMISSELAAEREAAGLAGIEAWATPNSMRDVEAETQFQLSEQLEQDA